MRSGRRWWPVRRLCVAGLLVLCGSSPGLADGELDGMAALLTGTVRLELDGDRVFKEKLFALAAFEQGEWGARASAANRLAGLYASRGASGKRHELVLWPDSERALTDALAVAVAPTIVGRYGPLPDGVLRIAAIDGRTRAKRRFSSLTADLTVDFVVLSSLLSRPVEGRYRVSAKGPLFGGRAAGGEVFVNGERLGRRALDALEQRHGVRALPGRYWYDRRAGLWGLEGGPSLGVLPARLDLPRRLAAKASGGGTRFRINGRILHPVEVAYLRERFGTIAPGRYVLDADGQARRRGSSQPAVDLRADGGSILGHSLTGSVIGDEGIVGFVDGATGVTCGPDGGCIF